LVQQPVARLGQGLPPQLRVALGAVWVRCGRLPDDRAVVGLAEQHLGGLSGRIDASDKHQRLPGRGEVTHDNAAVRAAAPVRAGSRPCFDVGLLTWAKRFTRTVYETLLPRSARGARYK